MNQNSPFQRKVAYVAAIAALLLPLAWLGQPATVTEAGGVLAQQRTRLGLSQAQLGKIDPASETMKLACFGLRGWAVSVLWNQAMEHKKKERWDDLVSCCEQIARLEPNFLAVWEFQAHNLAYNVSVDFDDYRQRYHWVKKGIDYLIEGTQYNRDNPRLLWYVGFIVGQKFGRSDERESFRRMFRDDSDFHQLMQEQGIAVAQTYGPDLKPDNWLMSREWFKKAELAVDTSEGGLKGKDPVLFHSDPPRSRMNYIENAQKDFNMDMNDARSVWSECYEDWTNVYARREFPAIEGFRYTIGSREEIRERLAKRWEALEQTAPGVRFAMRMEKVKELPEQYRSLAEDTIRFHHEDPSKMNDFHKAYLPRMLELTNPSPAAVAVKAPSEKIVAARALARQIALDEEYLERIRRTREKINFDYWSERCKAESEADSARARRLLFEGAKLAGEVRFNEAETKYAEAFELWSKVYKNYPTLLNDRNAEDVIDAVDEYARILDQLDRRNEFNQVLPTNFPLVFLLQRFSRDDLVRRVKDAQERQAAENKEGDPKDPSAPKPDKPAPEGPETPAPGSTTPDKPAASEEKPAGDGE